MVIRARRPYKAQTVTARTVRESAARLQLKRESWSMVEPGMLQGKRVKGMPKRLGPLAWPRVRSGFAPGEQGWIPRFTGYAARYRPQ